MRRLSDYPEIYSQGYEEMKGHMNWLQIVSGKKNCNNYYS